MADLADVCNTLRDLVAGTIYPNGFTNPSANGVDTRVFVGWPDPSQLDADLASKPPISQVSVYPRQEEHNTTRFPVRWQEVSRNVATLMLTVAGQVITIAGVVPPATNPHNVMLMVNRLPYVYAVQPSDTLQSIAEGLGELLGSAVSGTIIQANVITLPGSARLTAARVGVTGTAAQEVRRQSKLFQIGIWSAQPDMRDAIAKLIDPVLAATERLTLVDQSSARLIYRNSVQSDQLLKVRCYRRDLFYTVEYPTLRVETETDIVATQLNVSAEIAGVPPPQPVATVYA